MPHIAQWQNFYVIMGSSAGALTGLMFVVIVLTRDFQTSGSAGTSHARRSFATPTIVHFTTVLSLAGVFSMPGLTRGAVGVILIIGGVGLVAYVASITRRARRLSVYQADLEDHVFHFILP